MRTPTDEEIEKEAKIVTLSKKYNSDIAVSTVRAYRQGFTDGAKWMREQMQPKEALVIYGSVESCGNCGNSYEITENNYCGKCGSKLIFEPNPPKTDEG